MIFTIIAVLIAITIHEFAHAWVADQLGDPTAKFEGRMTLNPLAHLDPIGTIALFIAGFGWGKPVPVDTYNLQNPKRDEAIISLAGPLSNLVVAIILGLILKFVGVEFFLSSLIFKTILINLGLGIFNLLPIYPLDGSKILLGILPFEIAQEVESVMKRYGVIALLMVLLPIFGNRSIISLILSPVITFFVGFLL